MTNSLIAGAPARRAPAVAKPATPGGARAGGRQAAARALASAARAFTPTAPGGLAVAAPRALLLAAARPLLLAAPGVLLLAPPAGATSLPADADNGPAIIVTAPAATDTAALTDTPANAQLIDGRDALLAQNHANLADLLNSAVGSVSLSNGSGNPYQSDVAYRGFQATSLLGAPTGLSVYIDGVRMNEAFGAIVNWDLIPMNAIKAVEVLPGSNPLFGLNTLGGALVLDTKNGADNGGLNLGVQAGSWNRRAATGEAGGTLAGGALDWFVAGNHDEQDGYRWYTHSRVDQAYGKLRWHHGGAAGAELGVIWANTALSGTQSLPLSMLATPEAAYTAPDSIANRQLILNLKANVDLGRNLGLSGNGYFRRSNARATNSNAAPDDNCAATYDCTASAPGGTALDLNQANPYAAGTAQNAHFSAYGGPLPLHNYTSAINTALVLSATRQRVWGGNVLLDSDARLWGLKNDFNLGGSLESAHVTYDQNSVLAYLVRYQTLAQPWNLQYGSAAGFAGSPLINAVAVAAHSTSLNLFLRELLKPTNRLTLTASLSYTRTHVRLGGTNSTYLNADGGFSWAGANGQAYYNPAYVGAQYWATPADGPSYLASAAAPAGAVAGPEVAPVAGDHTYRRLNPAVGLTYTPRAGLNLFASYAEAMRAPTAIELACANPDTPCALPTGFNGDPALQPVIAHTLEAGARGQWGRHVSWNAAVYQTRLTNDIQFTYDTSGLGYFSNVGKTERRGAELGASAQWPGLSLSASYGFVAATYRAAFTDASGDTVAPGSHIPGIAAHSLKLRARYAPVPALVLGASLIATSAQWAHGDEANRAGQVPGYALVNLDAHVLPRLAHGRQPMELYVTLNNLFNRRYATYGVMGTNLYTGSAEQFRTPAPGRSVMLGLRCAFGQRAAPPPPDAD